MHLQNARCRKAAHQRLAHLGRVSACLAGKQQGLAHRSNVQSNNDLIRHLAGLAVTVAADQRDVFTHQLKQGFDFVKRGFRATDHDGQAGSPGADFTARHRCVQIVAAQGVDFLREFFGVHGRDGAHVDHGFAKAQTLSHAVFAKQDLGHIRRVRQHHEDDVGLLGHVLCRRAGLCFFDQQFGGYLAAGA